MNKLYFKYGTMGSGKSLQLISIAKNYELQSKKVLILSPKIDSRTDNIFSRNGSTFPCIKFDETEDLYIVIEKFINENIKCILIDESQFLNKKQVYQLASVADNLDIPVIAFGLKTNFKGELFEGSKVLLEVADSIEEIKTVCWFCNRKAIFNMRVDKNFKKISEGDEISLGFNNYVPVCRKCFFEKKVNY